MSADITIPPSAAVALPAGPTWVAFEGEPIQTYVSDGPFFEKMIPPSWATEALEPCDQGMRSPDGDHWHDDLCCDGGKRVLTFVAECPTCKRQPDNRPLRAVANAAGWEWCDEHNRPLYDGGQRCVRLHYEPERHEYYCPVWECRDCCGCDWMPERGGCPDCTAGSVTVSAHVVECLPIHDSTPDEAECPKMPHICIFHARIGGKDVLQAVHFDGKYEDEVTLHGDPKPGMYAVCLEPTA